VRKGEKMKKIPFINIADNDVWIVYLMPFTSEKRTDYERVNKLQQGCIKDKVFGMGWDIPCFSYGTKMTNETAAEYVDKYNAQGWNVSNDAVNGYKNIKKGDYVIMRLKNSHYYVGKVSSEGAFYIHQPEHPIYGLFSWGATVEKWIEYSNDGEIPSEIVGRFSQRLHPTIQRVSPYRQRLLIMGMYENKLPEQAREINIPKLHISSNNFVGSLNYWELEDLVAFYIVEKHNADGYRLLPSSCKVNQQKFEFRFVANNKKPITCQVKSHPKESIQMKNYVEDTSYEKIYIFSGDWSEEDVAKQNRKYEAYPHIRVISPKELWETFKNNNSFIFPSDFFDFDNRTLSPKELPLKDYKAVTKIKTPIEYTLSEDFACFLARDGFFYSREFGALILSRHIMEDLQREQVLIEQVMKDINRI
jgi:hypothetical protein